VNTVPLLEGGVSDLKGYFVIFLGVV